MSKFIISLIALILFVSPVLSQIKIKREDRVCNTSPDGNGYCGWSCISTLGRHLKIKSLYDLKDKRTQQSDFPQWEMHKTEWVTGIIGNVNLLTAVNCYESALSPGPWIWIKKSDGSRIKGHRSWGDWDDMQNKLNAAKVKFRIQEWGNFNTEIIKYAIWNKLGCMIVVKDWTGEGGDNHAMIIQSYDSDNIVLFDPNDIDNDYLVSWGWMLKWWSGYVLVIERN